jgi:hypothetical protein
LENDNYKLYFDRTVLTDIHIKHNRPDIIILNKQQKLAYLLDTDVPNSYNITQTYNTKINKYLEISVAMKNLWFRPLIISATGNVVREVFSGAPTNQALGCAIVSETSCAGKFTSRSLM